ncbi:MAG: Plastidic atp adp transporter [candidate division TM6 bacterium GW2011_GWF2_37_49]|nr:MAG: Plastidic atp adp transporter [candidate division TM6 bacterium GW2011_GWF2_37_49]
MHTDSSLNKQEPSKKEILLKILFLASTFLLMMMCLVVWRPLKIAIFAKIVGAQFIPNAKLFSLLFVIPLIIFYSKLVDWLRRHQLLYWFTLFHGIGGLIFYFFISHPVYGIANTQASSDRLVGWAFYIFMESFDAFFSTTFWAFADSICNPKDAKNYYGYIAAGSKIGGIIAAGGLYFIIGSSSNTEQIAIIPNVLLFGSCSLFAAALAIYFLMRNVSGKYMHGYEVVYQLEKTKSIESVGFWASVKGLFDGLWVIIKNPYVAGIFSMVVFYEIVIVIFDFWVVLYADKMNATVGGMTGYYAFYYFVMNLVGLAVCLLGTTPMLRFLGLRFSLLAFPLICFMFLAFTLLFPTAQVFFWVLVGLRAFNYALNHPTREVLYIPTTKEIKFKAKAWTEAFGTRIAKSFGSGFNVLLKSTSRATAFLSSLVLSLGLASVWLVIAYLLGRRLQDAIDNKKIIGKED